MITRSPHQQSGDSGRQLAVVTGASSGIGYELARCCAAHGVDLVIAADEPDIRTAARTFEAMGASVTAVEADLSQREGVDELYLATGDRPVDALLANAGRGLGRAFLDQHFEDIQHVVETNVTGTLYLIHKIGQDMRREGCGRILIVGSIAGFMPGTFQAVYNGTKAFLDNFSFALRAELKDSGVTVTCLMPGATVVAFQGFEAMMNGDGDVVTGWMNRMRSAIASITPAGILAEQHRGMTEPGSAHKK